MLKNNSLAEKTEDTFETEEDYLGYIKKCMERYCPNHRYVLTKKNFTKFGKKYYFSCRNRYSNCRAKLVFIRQEGMSFFIVSKNKHNH
jgi:hypothetical protein